MPVVAVVVALIRSRLVVRMLWALRLCLLSFVRRRFKVVSARVSVSDTGEACTGTVVSDVLGCAVSFAKASLVVEASGYVCIPCRTSEDHELDASARGCF